MDIIISYAWSHFYRAKPEVIRILRLFGDPAPHIDKTNVMGIAIAHTGLETAISLLTPDEIFSITRPVP